MAALKIYRDSRGTGDHCRSCGAAIEWAELVNSGKRMPFNEPIVVFPGNGAIVGGRVVEEVDSASSHFATCPEAKQWRRR